MDIKNGSGDAIKDAADHMLGVIDRVQIKSERTDFTFMSRKVVRYQLNVEVKGSNDRPSGRILPVFKDHAGRLTLEPLGEAVGALLRDGYCGQLCHVGFFA